ncbi:MAG: hydrogenase iron-sulfur subunit [Acidiferrobacterales bacterium]
MLTVFQHGIRRLFDLTETGLNRAFGQTCNPFHQLGALSFYFFWLIVVSGLYLYIFFETSAIAAYESVEYLTNDQWYLGGVMRSLHRYASDAFVVVITLHLIREFAFNRYRVFRWFSWVTGVPLLWLAFAAGIGGYWLVWDGLAQYIAVATAEWIDWLPVFTKPMARNFLNQSYLSDRFFSLLIFLHIAISLMLLLGMWIHIQRVTLARTNPPRLLAAGMLIALLVVSLIRPALSQGGPANLDIAISVVNLDWFYLLTYPLLDIWSAGGLWLLLGGLTLVLTVLPWLPPAKREPVAVVDPDNCNGCRRCFADCPFEAIIMQPHSKRPDLEQAAVNQSLCASCGICAGSCPSSTPFRSIEELVSGIDMPQLKIKELRLRTKTALNQLNGDARILIYGCDHAIDVRTLQDSGVVALSLPCIGMLPPSFVDYALQEGNADGVLITGCAGGDCYFRHGNTWMEQRIHGQREPYLRARVARERIMIFWAGQPQKKELLQKIQDLRNSLKRFDHD